MREITKDDVRTASELFKQWRKINEVRRSLVRDGLISGDATTSEILDALKKQIPPEMFGGK